MRWFNIQPKRSELQKKALKIALKTYKSNPEKYKDTMFCPYCGKPLVKNGKTSKLETLTEHVSCSAVSEKEEYICPSYCYGSEYSGCRVGAFYKWNGDPWGVENGGAYSSDFRNKLSQESKESVFGAITYDLVYQELNKHTHWNALNTLPCKSEIDIYRRGLPDRIRLWSWLTFELIQLTLNFNYQADEFGVVHKTWVNLGYLYKDKNFGRDEFNLIGQWPWHTWKFLYSHDYKRHQKNAKKYLKENKKKDEIYYEYIRRSYERPNNTNWPYRWYSGVMEFIHSREIKELEKFFRKPKEELLKGTFNIYG